MLQEASKVINTAFNNSFVRRLSQYLHDCVREEVKSSTFRNLKQDKENKWIFLEGAETLYTNFGTNLNLDGSDSFLTELMIQAEMSQKDKYLIYGYLFLVGKNSRSKKNNEFLTPLLYMPCKLERKGIHIECSLQDEVLSLNTGAVASLMKKGDDEDEMEHMLGGLLDTVPDLPLTEEKLQVFITTLKSLVPDIDIQSAFSKDDAKGEGEGFYQEVDEVNFDSFEETVSKFQKKPEAVELSLSQAIILTKRPTITAGVLHELTQISEKPSGVFRETALGIINDEYSNKRDKNLDLTTKPSANLSQFVAVTPLSLSDAQEDVIKKIEENPFVSVYGPPGTGKSQTIVNLVSHLVANGKTVLVASRMDKATDVVAQRLNELGAPYLALRAGRANYQKQLNFELQDLLSNKVDLDTGFENAVLVDVKDMHELVRQINSLEAKAEEIIKLEEQWSEAFEEKKAQEGILGELQFLNLKLGFSEVSQIKKCLAQIDENTEKGGLLSSFKVNAATSTLRKILRQKNLDLFRLRDELYILEANSKALAIEEKIHKIGNLHQILEQAKLLKKKRAKLAVEILKNKRREALKGLLRDQTKRQRLFVHSKSLVDRKRNLQSRLLEQEDFNPLLDAFPCWCVTTYAISNSLPLKSGLFDVAIIDEASQCDIASCFGVLYRAKRAVIVGDDKQLPHLSFLEKAKEQSFLSQYNIPDKYQLMWRFRTNSMFDLANYYSTAPVLLDEHFRSSKPIIEFSNREFYGSRIRIMRPEPPENNILELNVLEDGKVDFDVTRNSRECEALIKRLQEVMIEEPDASIGIISPFRGQVELIKKAVLSLFDEAVISKHKIEVGTAHTFQGDERDIMFISWTFAPNSHSQSLTFLQKPNLFNVAITRARKRQINFISKPVNALPEGILRSYLEFVQNYNPSKITQNVFKNDFEREVWQTFAQFGIEARAGVECAGLSVDLLIGNLAIELDGEQDNKKVYLSNMKKQAILERSGFKVIRITKREWTYSSKMCIERVKSLL